MSAFIRRAAVLFAYPTLAFAFVLPALGVVKIGGGLLSALWLGFLFSCIMFLSLFFMDMGNDAIDAISEPKYLTVRNGAGWAMVLAFFLTPGVVLKLMGLVFPASLAVAGFGWALVAGVGLMLGGLLVRLMLVD